jgi:hypothetical protein
MLSSQDHHHDTSQYTLSSTTTCHYSQHQGFVCCICSLERADMRVFQSLGLACATLGFLVPGILGQQLPRYAVSIPTALEIQRLIE